MPQEKQFLLACEANRPACPARKRLFLSHLPCFALCPSSVLLYFLLLCSLSGSPCLLHRLVALVPLVASVSSLSLSLASFLNLAYTRATMGLASKLSAAGMHTPGSAASGPPPPSQQFGHPPPPAQQSPYGQQQQYGQQGPPPAYSQGGERAFLGL